MDKNEFLHTLDQSINAKIIEILSMKPEDKKYLTYTDAIVISQYIKNIFLQYIGEVPVEIERACLSTELLLAPTTIEKIEIIKKLLGLGGGVIGITAVITGIGMALGWGSGIISSVIAFFTGTSIMGPVGLVVGGAGLIVIVGYFTLKDNSYKNTEKYREALRNSIREVVDKYLWEKYREKLQSIKRDS